MVEPALISVIIPCYNNADFIQECIASVLQQSYPHIEILIIDDGSSDDSLTIIRSFGDSIYWETQPNQGAPSARNRGLALAKGKYVKFLDADDILLPDCLAQQVRQSQAILETQKAIVYGDAIWVDQNRQILAKPTLRPRRLDEDAITHILTACPLTTCPLHQRNYLLEIQGFDPELPCDQEHDLHLRLVLAGVEFIYYPQAIYEYRNYISSDRISSRFFNFQESQVLYDIVQKQESLVREKLRQPLSPSIRKAFARRYWQLGRVILRRGQRTTAQKYFQKAQELAPKQCVVGRYPYRNLVKLIGPYRAELAITALRQLTI
jgi:glycosyltransferase involved in cell wall biosynthesis